MMMEDPCLRHSRQPKHRRRRIRRLRLKKAFQLSEARVRGRIQRGTHDTLSLHRRHRCLPKTHTSDHFFSYTEEHHQRDQEEYFAQLELYWEKLMRVWDRYDDDDEDDWV